MAGYRLYFLVDEHIKHAVTFECDTDAEAISAVDDHADGRAMELWSGARMVRRFPDATPSGERRP